MKNILILALTSIAILTNSCKKDKTCDTVECDLEGTYKVEVKVTKRLPYLFYSTDIPNFPHIKKHDLIFYDTTDVCCDRKMTYKATHGWLKEKFLNCPVHKSYQLLKVDLIKKDGGFYLKSTISENNNTYSHIKLNILNDKLIYNYSTSSGGINYQDTGLFAFSNYEGVESDINWVVGYKIKWIDLELKRSGNGYKGNWIFVHLITNGCEMTMPDGENSKYLVAEFAEVTFTKVE